MRPRLLASKLLFKNTIAITSRISLGLQPAAADYLSADQLEMWLRGSNCCLEQTSPPLDAFSQVLRWVSFWLLHTSSKQSKRLDPKTSAHNANLEASAACTDQCECHRQQRVFGAEALMALQADCTDNDTGHPLDFSAAASRHVSHVITSCVQQRPLLRTSTPAACIPSA